MPPPRHRGASRVSCSPLEGRRRPERRASHQHRPARWRHSPTTDPSWMSGWEAAPRRFRLRPGPSPSSASTHSPTCSWLSRRTPHPRACTRPPWRGDGPRWQRRSGTLTWPCRGTPSTTWPTSSRSSRRSTTTRGIASSWRPPTGIHWAGWPTCGGRSTAWTCPTSRGWSWRSRSCGRSGSSPNGKIAPAVTTTPPAVGSRTREAAVALVRTRLCLSGGPRRRDRRSARHTRASQERPLVGRTCRANGGHPLVGSVELRSTCPTAP